jgi:hypothetical protein
MRLARQSLACSRNLRRADEVVEGLSEKDRLLIAPPDDLQDGDSVRVTDVRPKKD